MHFSILRWTATFFVCCFLGWIWETVYVSVKKRQLVNRGFLRGPWLPIYGFGAVTILLVLLPFRKQTLSVFIGGTLLASILEYITGAGMEHLFDVRYWDYSRLPFNLNGHICLGVSLVWGVFAVVLIEYIHPIVESMILKVPVPILLLCCSVLLFLFGADVNASIRQALDIKKLVRKIPAYDRMVSALKARQMNLADAVEKGASASKEQKHSRQAKGVVETRDSGQGLQSLIEQEVDRRKTWLLNLQAKAEETVDKLHWQICDMDLTPKQRKRLLAQMKAAYSLQTELKKAIAEIDTDSEHMRYRAKGMLTRNPNAKISKRDRMP